MRALLSPSRAWLALGLMLALACGSRPSGAGEAVPSAWPVPAVGPLQQFDANRDGRLDAGEQSAAFAVFRSCADTDGDGRLSDGELRRAFEVLLAQPGLGRMALLYDLNRDGRLGPGEKEQAFAAFKARLGPFL